MPDILTLSILLMFVGIGWILKSSWFKGHLGEWSVASALDKSLKDRPHEIFHDVILPSGRGTTQIDHLVICESGIFVIETKNMSGWIFGNADEATWTQTFRRKRRRFQNPLRQNFKHLKAVEKALNVPLSELSGIVTFVGDAIPKTHLPNSVLWSTRELREFIQSRTLWRYDEEEISQMAQRFNAAIAATAHVSARDHVKALKQDRALRNNNENCPRCGKTLVQRINKRTQQTFSGCPSYPACRGTRQSNKKPHGINRGAKVARLENSVR